MMPATHHHTLQQIGQRCAELGFLVAAKPQTLPQLRLDTIVQLIDALLQAIIFVHQSIADQHPCHPRILRRKIQQHVENRLDLCRGRRCVGSNPRNQPEQGLFDELDQAFIHLRLARKVAIQCRLRHANASRQRGRGDFLRFWILQHRGQRLQNLQTALAGFSGFPFHQTLPPHFYG